MKATLNWLRDFVDIEMDIEELADKLTMAGLEVEEIIRLGEGLDDIVVGNIVDVKTHPEDKKLSIARVDIGKETVEVISSAPDVRIGLKTALALPGVVLPGGVKVEKRVFKGIESTGILLAEDEMGLTQDHTGLIELPEDSLPGRPITEVIDVKDYLLDLDITPNRADCLSILGLARDISVITKVPLKKQEIRLSEDGPDINKLTSIEVIDKDLCPRYVARVIEGVKIGKSPLWMRMRLDQMGIRDINTIVDITNYVLLEYGQPLHAFDYHLLSENRIIVKRASSGEKFFTLDAVERELNNDTLMICDGEKSVAVAGVMGGANSEIQEDTETVLLESAYFYPPSIHRTSKNLGIISEAAFRFERGIDPEGLLRAADRASGLMADLTGGVVAKGYIDAIGEIPKMPEIKLRTSYTKKIIGFDVESTEIRKYLQGLDIEIVSEKNDTITARPPSYRRDLTREIDLVEEVARLKGYDKIPETLPDVKMGYKAQSPMGSFIQDVSDIILSEGFDEIITYSFIGSNSFDMMKLAEDDTIRDAIPLKNPLSEEMDVMRTTLVPGIIRTATTNINHLNFDLRLFEIARVYIPVDGEKLPDERYHLSALMSGKRVPKQWGEESVEVDFNDIKGVWETIVDKIGKLGLKYDNNDHATYLDRVKSCVIQADGEMVGVMGRVDEGVAENFELQKDVYLLEVDLTRLSGIETRETTFVPIPRYPPVLRDVAVLVDMDVKSADVIDTIERAADENVKDVNIFDLYAGEQINEGEKSLALTIKYQSDERTLTDEEVNETHGKVLEVLKERLNARIR